MSYPTLRKAPIQEALLDIKVKYNESYSIDDLESLHHSLKEYFPEKRKLLNYKFQFDPLNKNENSSNTSSTLNGFIFVNEDNTEAVQYRMNGYAFSKIKSYSNWNDFISQAKTYWEPFFKKFGNDITTEIIALRYINIIPIPNPVGDIDLNLYFNNLPEPPGNITGIVSSFNSTMTLFEPKSKTNILLRYANLESNENSINIAVDIEVNMSFTSSGNLADMWENFDILRNIKNDVFFSVITKKLQDELK